MQSTIDLVGGTFYYQDNNDGTISIDKEWIKANIREVELPLFDRTYPVHVRMISPLCSALRRIKEHDLERFIRTCDGIFVPRHMGHDRGRPLSRHSWGVAIDINASDNPLGKPSNQHPLVVRLFKEQGFKWGGDFKSPYQDPMHFELL